MYTKRIHDWLAELAELRDAGKPLADGTKIDHTPKVTTTILGRVATNLNSMVTEYTQGTSLTGVVDEDPLKLQAVRPARETDAIDVITVTGSDPMSRQFAENGYSSQYNQETVASFMMITDAANATERYFGYAVKGDGRLTKQYVTETGIHTSMTILQVSDVELALQAFELVKADFDCHQ